MRLHQFLLVATATFLALGVVSSATEANQDQLSTVASEVTFSEPSARSLRVETDEEGGSEERADFGFASKLVKEARVRWWIERGTPIDKIASSLKLKNAAGKLVTSRDNYKYLEKVLQKREDNKLNQWLVDRVTTYNAWKNLGLDDIPASKLETSREWKVYERYVTEFDGLAIRDWNSFREAVTVSKNAKPAEMDARVKIMVNAKRTDDEAIIVLGLKGMSSDAAKASTNYQYYKKFLAAKKEKAA